MEPRALAQGAGLDPDATAGAVAVVGHICLDLIPQFAARSGAGEIAPGSLTHVGPALQSTGGAVSNAGLALHRLGVPVRLVGKVGQDLFGGEILRILQAHEPQLARGMTAVPGETTSYSIVISPPGVDRSFLHCPGANDTFTAADINWSELDGVALMHFGYPPIMRKIREGHGHELKAIFSTARQRGMITSLDMSAVDPVSEAGAVDWRRWLQQVLPETDLFLPSLDEILYMLRRPVDRPSPELLRAVADELVAMGAKAVVLKLGDQGLYLRSGASPLQPDERWADREVYTPCFQVDVVGTTGSGDCTIAGFLAAVVRGTSPEGCLTAAVATGACSVEQPDATSGVQSWRQTLRRVSQNWPRLEPMAAADAWPLAAGVYLGPADATQSTRAGR